MYLTKINPDTELVDISDINDGVLAIKEFSKVINHPDLGIECFTAIALTVDYASPIRYYIESERHMKAMKNVTGDSNKWPWANDHIQKALLKYDDLQFNEELKEQAIIREMKLRKLREVMEAKTDKEKLVLLKELDQVKTRERIFRENSDIGKALDNSPAKNDYKLSRLENKLKDSKSFYHAETKS